MPIPVYDWVRFHAESQPGKLAAVDVQSGRRLTYAALDGRVTRLARALSGQFGITKGDRVATLATNSTDQLEVQFAAQKHGFIYLPLNWRLAIPELEYICRDSTPSVLLYHESMRETALEIAKRAGIPAMLDVSDGADSAYERALAGATPEPLPPPGLTHDDPWSLIYTSGTTGRPKGALLTHGQMFFNAVHCALHMGLSQASVNLTFLPMFHVGGLCVFLAPAVYFGATNYITRGFDPAECLALFADKSVGMTHAFAVPTNLIMMEQLPAFAAADFSHLVSIGVGGAAPSPTLLATFNAKGMNLQHAWGMTETATLGLVLSPEKAIEKIGSAGRPVLHAQIRIADANGGDCAPGAVGELLIKGPTVTPGYWNKPEANALAFTDGWFRTGDAAVADAEGYISIVDRWKDMYISGGENVYPAEVENVLYQMNAVGECAVIGIPHEKWGEVGRAFIVMKPGAETTGEAITTHCRAQLARYKVPAEIRFVAELPHNATGKVTKHALPKG
jgi:fatty-acyl-CoA synthase